MLYLEDFLELIDQLPMELRDRFTEMRTLDLQVSNGLDQINGRIQHLLRSAAGLGEQEHQKGYGDIKALYKEVLEDAEEKVSLANTMYDLVERYQRKLEGEIAKFKMELEADNPGITGVLEQKVRDSEQLTRTQRRETKMKRRRMADDLGFDKYSLANNSHLGLKNGDAHDAPAALDPSLSRISAGRSPQTLQTLQRRTQSYPSRLSDIRALNAPQTPSTLINTFSEKESRHGRPRKLTTRVQEMLKESMDRKEQRERASVSVDGEEDDIHDTDADQRRWCICNKTSYGEMVACDNAQCPFEWFHYGCVGISQPPKGKWFCPHCLQTMKRRKLDPPSTPI